MRLGKKVGYAVEAREARDLISMFEYPCAVIPDGTSYDPANIDAFIVNSYGELKTVIAEAGGKVLIAEVESIPRNSVSKPVKKLK